MTKARICIIIPYYGKWPVYLPLFIDSCRSNPIIDVFLISDLSLDHVLLPDNVKLVKFELKAVLARLAGVAEIEQVDMSPSKLSDLKPVYGLMFPELIEAYDFWGYGDVDMIFGDLSRYLKPDLLERYDILTFREEWIHGPFTILRNNDYTKNLFKLSSDYKKVFSSNINYCFDECGKKHGILRTGVDSLDIQVPHAPNDVHCMTQVIRSEELAGNVNIYRRTYSKESLPFNEIIWYENGKILGAGHAEYIFYHFVWEKTLHQFIYPRWKIIPDRYFITTTGFYMHNNRLWRLTHYYRKFYGLVRKVSIRMRDSFKYRLKLGSKA